jgi:hypothetical protein
MAIIYKCPKCGGTEVGQDAASAWDVEAQKWILGSTYDDQWCNDCGELGYNNLVQETVPDAPIVKPPAIYALMVRHRHGDAVWLATSEKIRDEQLAGWVRRNWDQEDMDGVFNEEDPESSIGEYFDAIDDESYVFEEAILDEM